MFKSFKLLIKIIKFRKHMFKFERNMISIKNFNKTQKYKLNSKFF